LNKDVNSLKLHVIIRLLEERPDEQKRLSKVHDELQTVVQSVARINEQNKALIKQQLEMVEFDLNLIKSMNSAPETAEYNRTAAVNGNYMGGMAGSFDAKQ
jgi:flagellar biosynthesis/type III secretory pathway chaperone